MCLQVLQFVHGVAAQLSDTGIPGTAEMALQLFLTAAHSSSEVAGQELITYEFFEQVLLFQPTQHRKRIAPYYFQFRLLALLAPRS